MLDREIVDENRKLLIPRWEHLRQNRANPAAVADCSGRLGMDASTANQLAELSEQALERACDVGLPLFKLASPDDVLLKCLSTDAAEHSALDGIDRLIVAENEIIILNRWASARASEIGCQCDFGIGAGLVSALKNASLSEVKRTCRRGVRLAQLTVPWKYFFHAGKNVGLSRTQRRTLASCSSVKL